MKEEDLRIEIHRLEANIAQLGELVTQNFISLLEIKEQIISVKDHLEKLEKAGLNVTLRTRRGREIGGACGQLGKTLSDKIVEGKKLSGSKKYGNGED